MMDTLFDDETGSSYLFADVLANLLRNPSYLSNFSPGIGRVSAAQGRFGLGDLMAFTAEKLLLARRSPGSIGVGPWRSTGVATRLDIIE